MDAEHIHSSAAQYHCPFEKMNLVLSVNTFAVVFSIMSQESLLSATYMYEEEYPF
jgi:hypothetical protein